MMKSTFGGASSEAQVKYLQQCLRIQMDKNATLRMQIETQKMEHHLSVKDMGERLNELQEICNKQRDRLLALRSDPPPTHPAYAEPKPAPWGWVLMGALVLGTIGMAVWVLWRAHA